ncbi:uncharacterized protein Gm40011 isoform X3 [Mus musculus]|uniref:uncharacterized protein Gm40011 isoform X3 n=1 Tax=Mus musculus TaxID=10090 RepID=UPI0005AB9912|nr:uncharacterized protein Gm40011 isoform X3 [Mus musculus]|eukprot:XP_011238202.1 PREDICTED: uncharacterized protein Gm40011 isoform X4 [Mus musculus]
MINKRLYFRKPKPHDDKMFQGHSTERHDCSLIHHLSIMLKIISQVTLWKVTRAPSEHQCPHVQSAQGNSAGRERSLSAGPEWVPEEPRDGRRGHSVQDIGLVFEPHRDSERTAGRGDGSCL